MFARRNFLYKRSHHGGLAARDSSKQSSIVQVDTTPVPPSTSSAAKTTETPTLPTPVTPVTTAADTPTTSSSPAASPLSTPATPSASVASSAASASSVSASASQSLTSKASSLTPTTASVVSTPLTLGSTHTTNAASIVTRVTTGTLFTPTSSLSPSTTSSAGSSSGTNTGAVIGGIAGTLAGIAVLGFLLRWCMRRQRSHDIDDFDAKAFKRQSAILVDDPVDAPRSRNPRPPTMIEHHNASPALATQAGYGGQNFYGNYGGYGQQPSYGPSEMIQSAGSPPPQAYSAPSMGYAGYNDSQQQVSRHPSNMGYAGYDTQQPLTRQPSNATYLTRQPSSAVGYVPPTPPPGSFDPNAHYVNLNRSSVSPYQAAQYADISRQLGTTDPNRQVPPESSDLPEGPLPSPFDDPVEAAPAPGVTSSHHPSDVVAPGPVSTTSAPQTQGNTTEAHQRPATVYDEGDAYGGI